MNTSKFWRKFWRERKLAIVELEKVSYAYGKSKAAQDEAISDISFKIEEGEYVGIIGHTGSGKSTLIKHLNCILKPTCGKIYIDGVDVWKNKATVAGNRQNVGLVFQYPEYQLFEETVEKDIAFGPKNLGLSADEVRFRVARAIEMVGLSSSLLGKNPFELSGGEKRRVAIAGILAMNPKILVFDEPTVGLDPAGKEKILNIIKYYNRDENRTIVHVTHSMEDIARYADMILIMNGGKILSFDSVEETFKRASMLRSVGLDVPKIYEVFLKLKDKGFDVPLNVYTIQRALEVVKNIVERKVKP